MKNKTTIILLVILGLLFGIFVVRGNTAEYIFSRKLVYAIRDQDTARVAQLISSNDYDVNTPTGRYTGLYRVLYRATETSPEVPLTVACYCGNYEIIKMLIDAGADCSAQDALGSNPMVHLLYRYDDYDYPALKYMLENGADPNLLEDRTTSPLAAAARSIPRTSLEDGTYSADYSPEIAQTILDEIMLLFEYGAVDGDSRGRTILHYAVGSGNFELVKYCIHELGYDVNRQDIYGKTPLFYIAKEDQKILEYILAQGVDLYITDNDGKSLLDYLLEKGFLLNN